METPMKKLLICDTSALFFRGRSALTRTMGQMTTSYGATVTGTFAYLNTLFSLMERDSYDCVVHCTEGGNNWRKKTSDDYKSNRERNDQSFYADMSLLVGDVLPTLGMTPVSVPTFEADDIIATLSRHAHAFEEVHIATVDADLLQLVNNKVKVIMFSSTKKMKLYDIDGVLEKYGIYPSEVKYWKSLCGDPSDNIAGIKGVGAKTAAKIIEECRPTEIDPEFTGADRIAMHPKVRENAGIFLANLRLTTLENDVPGVVWFASSPPPPEAVQGVLTALEFKSMLKRLEKIQKTLGCSV
jgi:DNA polymerase-1